MIRKLTTEDVDAGMRVAEATGLFDGEQMGVLRAAFLSPPEGVDSPFWLGHFFEDRLCGLVYCEPERMTQGTWNMQLIAVHPSFQKQRIGAALIAETERMLGTYRARILLVDTAGLEEFEYVRRFYLNQGFQNEARIRDFYSEGVDRVTFRKLIQHKQQLLKVSHERAVRGVQHPTQIDWNEEFLRENLAEAVQRKADPSR